MRVRAVFEWEIDPTAWVADAANECEIYDDEIDPTDLETVANRATEYCNPEDHLPRWARGSVRVVSQTVEVVPECPGCGELSGRHLIGCEAHNGE